MHLEPLDATFGATVMEIDLAELDQGTWEELHAAWVEHALLIFPGQRLDPDTQNTFARRFGRLEFEAVPISNLDRDGQIVDSDDDVVKVLRGNEGWHHDSTYMPIQAKGAVFSAEIVPSGGAPTGWADMRAAYDDLDTATHDLIADKVAYHSLYYSQGRAGYLPSKRNESGGYDQYGFHDLEPSLRPLIKVHPDTGRPNLLIGRHAYGIVGMEPEASEALLDHLNEWACEAPRVYHHHWSVGDVVVWDNRRLMHRAAPVDMTRPRRMWHTRIAGEPESELALNHA
jgi:alpha-ketoglutarate-dependent taurine dioxygenase